MGLVGLGWLLGEGQSNLKECGLASLVTINWFDLISLFEEVKNYKIQNCWVKVLGNLGYSCHVLWGWVVGWLLG